MGGVAEQGYRGGPGAVPPPRGAPGAEVSPPGVVHQQWAAADLLGEQFLQVGAAGLVAGPGRLAGIEGIQAGGAPGWLVGLDEERRDPAADRVGVHCEDTVRALLVHEGQAAERVGCAEPDELGRRCRHRGTEDVREPVPHRRVGPVGRDHQVISGLQQIARLGRRGEPDVHPGLGGPLLQQGQQGLAGHGGHPVATELPALAAQPHLDLVPVGAVVGQRAAQDRIGGMDALQSCVGEHHPEPESVSRPVALEHGDLAVRVAALGQQRGQQAARAAT